jgi:ABC-type Fe3+-hydroxamate transport system substrate-binding protein
MSQYPLNLIDQMGHKLILPKKPQRIVSLVPSQTELLFDLNLNSEVVGITKFCIHPDEWFRTKTRIGGTKQLNIDVIRQLQPDLIIGNKEENEKSQIEILQKEFPVWMSDISTLEDALEMIHGIGILTSTSPFADRIVTQIENNFKSLITPNKPLRTLYLIWHHPNMCAGTETFIQDMLEKCGLINATPEIRYPELSDDDIVQINPELVLLSSEPYPFKEKHLEHFRKLLPKTQVTLVNGEMFSWYGSRLLQSASYFNKLLAELR